MELGNKSSPDSPGSATFYILITHWQQDEVVYVPDFASWYLDFYRCFDWGVEETFFFAADFYSRLWDVNNLVN